jgi:hypothetical protein
MGGMHRVRWFNAAFVLLLPHQLGHFLATARSRGCRAGVFWGWWSRGRCGLSLFSSDLPSTAGRDRKGRGAESGTGLVVQRLFSHRFPFESDGRS